LPIRVDLPLEQRFEREIARDLGANQRSGRRADDDVGVADVDTGIGQTSQDASLPGNRGVSARSEHQRKTLHVCPPSRTWRLRRAIGRAETSLHGTMVCRRDACSRSFDAWSRR
jgi:hypothetical protein